MVEKAIPEIDAEKCTGCGDCVEQCPTGAVAMIDGKVVIVKPENCNYCTLCEAICPSNVIRCPFEIILANVEPQAGGKAVTGTPPIFREDSKYERES